MKIIKYLINLFSRDFILPENLLNKILFYLSDNSKKSYYTYHARPKNSDNFHLDHYKPQDFNKVGVVIQGPIRAENDFTLQTALLYKKIMPGALVVLSTWDDEFIDENFLFQNNIELIKSKKPSTSGLGTTNFQIISTIAAIKHLEYLGCEYVMKTRSDQRIYAQNVIPFFLSLLEIYPPISKRQKSRIIELSMNICRYRPYSMCDMFQFGSLEDMKLMWDLDLDPRNESTANFSKVRRTSREISEAYIGEIYIHRNYLNRIGANNYVSLNVYYKNLIDYFIIVDKEQVDLYWDKYNSMEYGIAENPLYSNLRQKSRIYFRDWLAMYIQGIDLLSVNDKLLDEYE